MPTNPLDPPQNPTPQNGLFNTPPPTAPAPVTPPAATATPTTATSVGFQAAPYTVDADKGTVQGQLKSIVDKGSPLQQLAVRDANAQMNQRGLLNSSLAVGAAQDAVYKTALPIAQADAGVYDKAMTNTANVENAARQFGAAAENQASLTNAQLASSIAATNAQEVNKMGLAGLDAQTRVALGNLDVAARQRLAAIDTNSRILIQTNASASEMYGQAVKNIADLSRDPNLRPDAKRAAIDSQLNLLNQGLRQLQEVSTTNPLEIEGLDVSQFFKMYSVLSNMTPQQYAAKEKQLISRLASLRYEDNPEAYQAASRELKEFYKLVPVIQAANAPANTQSLNLQEGF